MFERSYILRAKNAHNIQEMHADDGVFGACPQLEIHAMPSKIRLDRSTYNSSERTDTIISDGPVQCT